MVGAVDGRRRFIASGLIGRYKTRSRASLNCCPLACRRGPRSLGWHPRLERIQGSPVKAIPGSTDWKRRPRSIKTAVPEQGGVPFTSDEAIQRIVRSPKRFTPLHQRHSLDSGASVSVGEEHPCSVRPDSNGSLRNQGRWVTALPGHRHLRDMLEAILPWKGS